MVRGVPSQDFIGRRFERLIVVRLGPRCVTDNNRSTFICICDCGRETKVRRNNLLSGSIKSCGCGRFTHGQSMAKEYRIWGSMRARCSPGSARGQYHADRGIKVCERWSSFANFIADMGPRPSSRHSIDRIDNNGDYEPGNCRWVLPTVQANNRGITKRLTFNGRTQAIADWARELGLEYATITWRLKQGWPVEDALSFRSGEKRRAA